jgi:LysM repeat protein
MENTRIKMYKSGKTWVAAAVVAVAAAAAPFFASTSVSADDTASVDNSWRAKSVDDVKAAGAQAGTTYTVQSGDTVSAIAEATGLSVDDIVALNNLSDANYIVVGDELNLDSAAQAASQAAVSEAPATETVAESAATTSYVAPAAQSTQTATVTPAVNAGSMQAYVDALNAVRAQAGLSQLTYDAGLASTAAMRAATFSALGDSVDAAHYAQSYGKEVAVWGIYAYTPSVAINEWVTEAHAGGTTAHRRWVFDASSTRVGFALVGDMLVAIAA